MNRNVLLLLARLCLAIGLAGCGCLLAEEVVPQTIHELQIKAAAEPFSPAAIRTSGIVTWVDPSEGKYFQLQDNSAAGIQVSFNNTDWPLVGDTLELEGLLERGPYAPVIASATFRHKGRDIRPVAQNASGGGLLNGEFNGLLIDLHGYVRSAEMANDSTFTAVLNSGLARVTVRVSNARNLDPVKLIAAKIWLRGVAVPVSARGDMRQLVDVQVFASSEDDFHVFQLERFDPWKSPLRPLQQTYQYRPGFTRGDRARVRGQLVYERDGVAYLNDGKSGVAVRGTGAGNLKRGEDVEAVGFPDLEDFLPVLSDAVFASFPPAENPVKPKPMPVEALLDGLQHAAYVTVRGRLLDRLHAPSPDGSGILVLALNTPRGVFTAEMEEKQGEQIPGMEEGCTLDASGICLVSADGTGNPSSFKILIPGRESITVVERASFFTVKRLLVMLSVALGGLAAVAIFAYFISRRNLKLASEVRERTAVTAERSRLARDLHDTLEQGLTGIHLQLHSIGNSEEDASLDTRERLQAVDVLVKQCHAEMRQSIWNLRSVALEQFDLAEAIERAARSIALGSDIRLEVKRTGTPVKLPPLIEDNLLRIGQEAVTNSVKHARPTRLTVELATGPKSVTLVVSDDGAGIQSPARPGHFGLTGMGERAVRIGGKLEVTANPGGGTMVRVEVPLRNGSSKTQNESAHPTTRQDPRR